MKLSKTSREVSEIIPIFFLTKTSKSSNPNEKIREISYEGKEEK